jgi:hypothetical protein
MHTFKLIYDETAEAYPHGEMLLFILLETEISIHPNKGKNSF